MSQSSWTAQKGEAITNNGNSLQCENESETHEKLQEEDKKKVELGKKVTLLRGISIIVGIIIGAGIFISPKGILKNSGSVGMSLVVWIACGVLSLFGELVLKFNQVMVFFALESFIECYKVLNEVDMFVPALNTCIRGKKSKKTIEGSNIFGDH